MKTVMVMGLGAQGSTIAKRLDEEPNVGTVICADYDEHAVSEMETTLKKARGVKVDARSVDAIAEAAKGADLIVNGLAPDFNLNILEACLKVGANYQDMASGPVSDVDFVQSVKRVMDMNDRFKKAGLTALINTGSAPGLANVIAREAVEQVDSCEAIEIFVYDEVWSKTFIPFWWSPETAFGDMAAQPVCYKDGHFIRSKPFSNPEVVDFVDYGEARVVDHEHEEPVTMGLLADSIFKGVKYVNFRYGGPGLELAESLYKMGLLSEEPVEVNGQKIIPMDLISKLTPPAPKYPEEIEKVLEKGMISEDGVFLVRVDGVKDGKKIRLDSYASAPGLSEAFEKAQITHESYLTGQSAFLFTKMFVNDVISQQGVYPPEVLEEDERTYFFHEAAKLDITIDQYVKTQLD